MATIALLDDSAMPAEGTLLLRAGLLCVEVQIRTRPDGTSVLSGQILAGSGHHPVPDVDVEVGGGRGRTDAAGEFRVPLPGGQAPHELRIRAPQLEFLCAVPVAGACGA
jgi:hypothetical protein